MEGRMKLIIVVIGLICNVDGAGECGSANTDKESIKLAACEAEAANYDSTAPSEGLSDGAGQCGEENPEEEAFKLVPCAGAASDDSATPSSTCCTQLEKMVPNPGCLCAVMLSDSFKRDGFNPLVFITIPKRCSISDRPVGYKCGDYILP